MVNLLIDHLWHEGKAILIKNAVRLRFVKRNKQTKQRAKLFVNIKYIEMNNTAIEKLTKRPHQFSIE